MLRIGNNGAFEINLDSLNDDDRERFTRRPLKWNSSDPSALFPIETKDGCKFVATGVVPNATTPIVVCCYTDPEDREDMEEGERPVYGSLAVIIDKQLDAYEEMNLQPGSVSMEPTRAPADAGTIAETSTAETRGPSSATAQRPSNAAASANVPPDEQKRRIAEGLDPMTGEEEDDDESSSAKKKSKKKR